MGQNQSSSVASIVSQAAASVIVNNIQNCSASSSQAQNVVGGFLFFSDITQTSTINQTCVANFQVTNDITTAITNAIQQAASEQNVALLSALQFNSAQTQAYINNLVSTSITSSMVQNAYTSSLQSQNFLDTIAIFSTVSQSSSAFQSALETAISNTSLATSLQTNTKQSATQATTNPLDIFGDITEYILIFIVVIILAILGFVGYALFGG